MLKIISVETGLQEVKEHLNACGYEVVDMENCYRPVEAVVFTGEQKQNDACQTARMPKSTVVINAMGMDAPQVAAQIEAKLG